MKRSLVVSLLVFAGALAIVSLLPSGYATITRDSDAGCDVQFNGISAATIAGRGGANETHDVFTLQPGDNITIAVKTEFRIRAVDAAVEYGPAVIPLYNETINSQFNVRDFEVVFDTGRVSSYGLGLYVLTADIETRDNFGRIHDCNVEALFFLQGQPLQTVTGGVAVGVSIGAAAGLVQGAVSGAANTKEVVDAVKDLREAYKSVREITG